MDDMKTPFRVDFLHESHHKMAHLLHDVGPYKVCDSRTLSLKHPRVIPCEELGKKT